MEGHILPTGLVGCPGGGFILLTAHHFTSPLYLPRGLVIDIMHPFSLLHQCLSYLSYVSHTSQQPLVSTSLKLSFRQNDSDINLLDERHRIYGQQGQWQADRSTVMIFEQDEHDCITKRASSEAATERSLE